ncbi:MAG: hypothetical protein D6730_01935 [Bacteroidetes bacterium]|nr:MAG: hypothetical protein D6730_01935 [Bacteroidota bacterium]
MFYTQKVKETFISRGLERILPKEEFVQMPGTELEPLSYYVRKGKKVSALLNDFDQLFTQSPALNLTVSRKVSIPGSGNKSGFLSNRKAVDILGNYLTAWGIEPDEIVKKLKLAGNMALSFPKLSGIGFSKNDLRNAYRAGKLETANPTAGELLKSPPPDLWLVHSVVVSKGFSLHLQDPASLDLKTVKTLIDKQKTGVSVQVQGGNMSVMGSQELAVAFSHILFGANAATGELEIEPGKGEGRGKVGDG